MKAARDFLRKLDTPWLAGLLTAAAFALYFIQAVIYAHSMDVTMDEGTYLMKGLLFIKGIYRPFQEFGPITNKMPLSYLIPGAAQAVFGPGLRTGEGAVAFGPGVQHILMPAAVGLGRLLVACKAGDGRAVVARGRR